MKAKKLTTLEKYTVVAVRAKLSVEAEQRKRLGTWAKRVLVLDGSTLYAYKTKGEGGSVGGWTVGGADVRVGRGSDSSKDDGRHLLVISRPPAYKLTFSFNTTYEQARMIQALSSSGATVTGIDAIMLLKNLKKQQEEEQEEEEERQKQLREQRKAFEESRQRSDTTTSAGSGVGCEDDDLSMEYEKNREEEELEIKRSIYDAGTGVVSNPLYSSQINLSSGESGGEDSVDKSHSASTYRASEASTRDSGESKVNPVPKPPRTSHGDRRPSTESSQSLQPDDEAEALTGGSWREQCRSGGKEEESFLFDNAPDLGEEAEDGEGISEARNWLYYNPEDSEEDEGSYQLNRDSDEDDYRGSSESDPRRVGADVHFSKSDPCSDSSLNEEEKDEEGHKEPLEGNYSDLLNKMKLERALSIDLESSGHYPDFGSTTHSALKSVSPTGLDDGESGSDREGNGRNGSERERGDAQSSDEEQNMVKDALAEALSDNEEKFEQLYNSLRNRSLDYQETEGHGENELSEQTTNAENAISTLEAKQSLASHENVVKENGFIEGEDLIDSPSGSPSEVTPKKRVNSIIKKKGKGVPTSDTGTIKKVQFSLEVDTIQSPSMPESDLTEIADNLAENNEESAADPAKEKLHSPEDKNCDLKDLTAEDKTLDSKKDVSGTRSSHSKKKSTGSPVTSPSKTKKKGIFSSIFSNSSAKKGDASQGKDDTGKKKPSDSPVQTVRQQQTIDFSSPAVISGQVEIGGSVGGKLNTRRLEVRNGQLLAFLPRSSSTPSSRISLLGLSVTPVLGGAHAHALAITRAARCMMVIKLGTREEQMLWINTLSDEVIKITPDDQRSGLTLYPTQKREEDNKFHGEETWQDKQQQQESKDPEREQRGKMPTNATYAEDAGNLAEEVCPRKKASVIKSQEVPVVNGEPLDSSDDKGKTVLQESDGHVFSPQRSASLDDLNEKEKERELKRSVAKHHGRTVSESGGERRLGIRIDEKIRQLSLGQPEPGKRGGQTRTRSSDGESSSHRPLCRPSGTGRVPSPSRDFGVDTVDNYLMVSSIPGSSAGDRPKGKVGKFGRISSESSLRGPTASSSTPRLEGRGGGEVPFRAAGNRRAATDGIPTRGSGGSQTSAASDPDRRPNEARASSTCGGGSSSSSSEVEIAGKCGGDRGRERSRGADGDRWFRDNDSSDGEAPAARGEAEAMPRITWSVAATREKFELLCSVGGGESKGGRLTTKTPISRKRSGRGAAKRKRSLEGASLRRSRGVRQSLEEELISSSQELQADAGRSGRDRRPRREARLRPVEDLEESVERDRTSSPRSLPSHREESPLEGEALSSSPKKKTSLRRTSNVLQEPSSPASSSPEPRILTSRFLNTRPNGNLAGKDTFVRPASTDSSRPSSAQDNDVVVCWRGPYIAQEAEQEVLSNISNAFLAKRRLLAKEVASAKIQKRLSLLEERLWSLQASMADIDASGSASDREAQRWKSLERSVRAVEEETLYWNARLTQTQKEAERARQKLAAALTSGLAQLSPGTPEGQRLLQEDDASEA